MGSVLEAVPVNGRVAIIRLRSLGDCVLTTPAIDLLKRFRPDLRVFVVAEPRFHALFEENPDLEQVLAPSLGELRRLRPNLCLNFHGGTRSAWMTALSGAKVRAGFGHYRFRSVYNVRIPRAQEILGLDRKVHTAEHLASAMFHLGVPRNEIPRAKLVATGRLPAEAVIHAVAAAPDKTWSASGFLEVARRLRDSGAAPVFIGGPGDDLSAFREFPTRAGAPLAEVKSLMASASLFVGNDSGPAHMAAAFGVPSVVIFGSSDAEIWAPWRAPAEVVTARDGIHAVTVDQVMAALARLRVAA